MAPIKISLANRLYLGFALVVLLVLLSGFLTWRTFDSQMEEASWVQHTYHVLNNSERIQRLLFDMESARRGFRSTFDHRFLEPYELALPKVAPALNDLHSLVSDNPEQYKNVDSLEDEVNKLLSFWNELDHALDSQRFEQNKAITEKEAVIMDRVRAKISLVNAEERRLLALRENYKNESFSKAVRALLINNAFILLVGCILMRVAYIEFKRRLRAQKALNGKLTEVVDLNAAANERNWMLTGVNKMNDSLQGANSREELVHSALQTLTTFGEFSAGAFYRFNEGANHLRLEATVNMPAAVPAVVAIDDGFVGTAASNPDLRVIRGVPPSYWQLSSASGNSIAGELVLIPLWVDNELLGVIELASFQPVTPLQVRLLEILKKDIAVAVNAANAREKVMQLLRQVQE